MKIYFETLGCPKNFNDTQAAKGIMAEAGYEIAETADKSDVIVVNSFILSILEKIALKRSKR